ncbi:class I SAM-dependent methyltransferase [Rathayibacter sp. VKM Ac-2929]|uniref:N-6 DNA methylase n=1 Tax=Rathayibacter sp. VKM Ac-2929 TaxID=2929480 RepID=UPI001FB480DE|nr:class I SAM-dependent methyltransferase [Rathayibacter sp. VKM Ac-2929]MCJ1675673.1 class I SAM-dependent methyltransferase [Rathayibacter sp. VKM Ac-2929]
MSSIFAAKAAPADDKLRGGYYTPDPLARFVAQWVAAAGPRLLEPSCGDGAILKHLAQHGDAIGVELFPEEAHKARAAADAKIVISDFFKWLTPARHGAFDGVAGNPPFIRFGSWEEQYRAQAFELMREQGLKPTRLTNAWLPFVVASLVAVRTGGRVGLVLPAELLQVSYAAELRAYLIDSCSDITVVSFSELVFPGILQEVVLLLAVKGDGPATIRTVEVKNGSHLQDVTLDGAATRAPLHESEKWTKYFLAAEQIDVLRAVRADPRLAPLRTYAAVNVGVVTGRNSFFCLTADQADALGIADHTINLLSRSAQLTGTRYTETDLNTQAGQGARTRLLAVPANLDLATEPALARYVALGEAEGVHLGYKCSIRTSWWSVPSIAVPDGFMLRQVSTVLRLTSNKAAATSTDTVHRVFTKPGVNMDQLAVAAFNSVTLAMSEIMGRSYGGGLLEIEPSEAVSLPVPDPRLVSSELIEAVDDLLSRGRTDEALQLVDEEVLIGGAGFDRDEIARVHLASTRLRNRRLGRGRKTSVEPALATV